MVRHVPGCLSGVWLCCLDDGFPLPALPYGADAGQVQDDERGADGADRGGGGDYGDVDLRVVFPVVNH